MFFASYDLNKNTAFLNWFYDSEFAFGIAKYAICILTGIILAYLICSKEGERLGINKDKLLTVATIVVPLCILGARIAYLVGDGESSFKTYLNMESNNFFMAIIDFLGFFIGFSPELGWTYLGISGLAIHGGIIVAIIAVFIASKIMKWRITAVGDLVGPGLFIGQICGRWGNFFNQEAHGIAVGGWDLIDGQYIPRIDNLEAQYEILTKKWLVPPFIAKFMRLPKSREHYDLGGGSFIGIGNADPNNIVRECFFYPTFYFESMLNLLGLGIYFALRRTKFVRSGYFAAFYLIWYGIVRFAVEAIRTDSLYLPGTQIKGAQFTSILMILAGIFLIVYFTWIKKTPKYVDIIEENKKKEEESK